MARPRNTTDQQILDAARVCFLEYGAGVATTLIASRLGISHATLFQRFGTKEQLMRAALLPAPALPWIMKVEAGPEDREVRAQLLELAQEIYKYLDRIVPCLEVLRSAGLLAELPAGRPGDAPPVRARRKMTTWFARAIERGLVHPAKPEHMADLFLGALFFRPHFQHIAKKRFGQADSRAYLELVVDTLCQRLEPPKKPLPPVSPSPRRRPSPR